MPNIFGYLRPEINTQNIQLQHDQLKSAGVSRIFQEKPSDKQRNRSQWDKLMTEALDGDTVVVASLDRIA